jgi:putative transposase
MSATFSQLYIQVVFSVKNRESLINLEWEEKLFKYISGIIHLKDQKLYAINGTSNHIHILISLKPNCNLSDLVREIKKSSTKYINEMNFNKTKFQWQEGFGAFSYSHSHVPIVIKYILNQKEHHKKVSFKEEYLKLLEKFNIEYNEKYVFEWI